jgi:protein O-mannosyl-transferase
MSTPSYLENRKTVRIATPRLVPAQPLLFLILAAIALMAYANSFGQGFAMDSPLILLKDPRLRQATMNNWRLIWDKEYWYPNFMSGLYRPVATATYFFNYAILGNGERPLGYHLVNLLLHIPNVWMVFLLGLRLLRRSGPAFFAAAIWAVHPIGTETVTNIVGRADELATLSVLACLLLYARGNDIALAGRRSWLRLSLVAAAIFICSSVGMLAKESAAVLLGLMVLWDLSFGIGPWRSGLLRRLPAYAAALAALALLWWARDRVFGPAPPPELAFVDNPLIAAGFWEAKLTALKVICLYLGILSCPIWLTCDRSYNNIPVVGFSDPKAWLALLFIGAILSIVIIRYRRDPLMFFAAGFFGITLLPTSNLIFPIGSIMAERFLYLPSIAFVLAMVALSYRVPGHRPDVALALILVLFTLRTVVRNPDWNNDMALTSHDVNVVPDSFKLHGIYARALFDQNPRANIDRVIEEAELAWDVLKDLPPALIFQQTPNNLGAYDRVKGDFEGGPGTPEGRRWYLRSLAVLLKGRVASVANEKAYDQRQLDFGKPMKTRLALQNLYLNLGYTLAGLGQLVEARDALIYGRDLGPATAEFYSALAGVYQKGNNPQWALYSLIEKTQVEGMKPETVTALRKLYAANPQASCAIVGEGTGARLNVQCAPLHEDLCASWVDLARAFLADRNRSEARSIKDRAVLEVGCLSAPFDAILPEGPAF